MPCCGRFEAGGHNGADETTTFALVPHVVDASQFRLSRPEGLPMAEQMLAAIVLGAEGVQMGTRFAATVESSAHERYKRAIVEAKEGDTVLTLKKVSRSDVESHLRCLPSTRILGKSREELEELLGSGREGRESLKGIGRRGNSR